MLQLFSPPLSFSIVSMVVIFYWWSFSNILIGNSPKYLRRSSTTPGSGSHSVPRDAWPIVSPSMPTAKCSPASDGQRRSSCWVALNSTFWTSYITIDCIMLYPSKAKHTYTVICGTSTQHPLFLSSTPNSPQISSILQRRVSKPRAGFVPAVLEGVPCDVIHGKWGIKQPISRESNQQRLGFDRGKERVVTAYFAPLTRFARGMIQLLVLIKGGTFLTSWPYWV